MNPVCDLLSDDSDDLFARARAGDEAAWDELFHKCYPKVIRVVRRKLNRPMRSLYDSTDFASDVMKSLAANKDRLNFPTLESLIAFLKDVAEKKVIDEYRRVHTQKRDIDRQCGLQTGVGGDEHRHDLESDDPTASQVALAGEARALLLADKSEPERAVIEMKTQGYSPAEIAHETGWHLRKVQRFFKSLHDSLAKSGHL
jgi:RNA polymerase sigma factor (sigma-70 family)